MVLSSQQDKVKNHALHIYNMASQFIMCFWKPHLAFPYSPPSSGSISTIPYFSAPSNSCSLLSGQPTAKGWVFFPEDPSAKLGFLPLSWLRRDRQVAPQTSAVVPEPKSQQSPHPSSVFPSQTKMGSEWHPHCWIFVSTPPHKHTEGNGGAAFHAVTESGLC